MFNVSILSASFNLKFSCSSLFKVFVTRGLAQGALAIRFEGLVRDGTVANFAELARLSQIMLLLQLAPEIQEEILFLPRVTSGKDPITERDVQPIAMIPDWGKQRSEWRSRTKSCSRRNYGKS